MPDTTPTTPAPFRYVDGDDFCLSARLLPDLNTGRPTGTVSITIEGSDEPQSAHVPLGELPQVLAGIATAAGVILPVTAQPPAPAEVCTEHGAACHTRDWPAPGAVTAAPADRAAVLREAASAVESSDVAYNTEAATAALTNGGPFALIAFVQLAIGAHLRRLADEAQPATDRPTEAVMALRCSAAVLNRPHGTHLWEPQSGMPPLRCLGLTEAGGPAADQPDTESEAAPNPADLNRQMSTTCTCGHALRWHLPDCRQGSGHGCPCLTFTPDTKTKARTGDDRCPKFCIPCITDESHRPAP